MTNEYTAPGSTESSASIGDTASTARDQAGNVGRDAAESAQNVAATAKDETGKVVGESKKQAKALYDEARTQLTDQAGVQQERVASGLRGIGDELARMAEASEQPGIAGDIVSQVASRTSAAATWLGDRNPGSLLTEVKDFARRKPGTFIAVSAVAGLVAGRLVKNLASAASDESDAPTSAEPASEPPSGISTPVEQSATVPEPSYTTEPSYATETPVFDTVRPAAESGLDQTPGEGRQP